MSLDGPQSIAVRVLSFASTVEVLRALGEPTRLRLVRLLRCIDLTVSDMTAILGQSQPRVSRHLRLLVESGVVSRYQEGAWAYFRLNDSKPVAAVCDGVLASLDAGDPVLARDFDRLETVRHERAARASDYFSRNATSWDRLRRLHVDEGEVEAALLHALGPQSVTSLLDIGTGTGRVLELLAPKAERAIGVDVSREMLQVARAKLDAAGIAHAQVRQGDCYRLPLSPGEFDLVTLHQVLHYLDDPAAAVREAASMLRPDGRLAIVDFAPHALEFLRDEEAHLRLGFSAEVLGEYAFNAGLDIVSTDYLVPEGARTDQLTVVLMVARNRRAAFVASHPRLYSDHRAA